MYSTLSPPFLHPLYLQCNILVANLNEKNNAIFDYSSDTCLLEKMGLISKLSLNEGKEGNQ